MDPFTIITIITLLYGITDQIVAAATSTSDAIKADKAKKGLEDLKNKLNQGQIGVTSAYNQLAALQSQVFTMANRAGLETAIRTQKGKIQDMEKTNQDIANSIEKIGEEHAVASSQSYNMWEAMAGAKRRKEAKTNIEKEIEKYGTELH